MPSPAFPRSAFLGAAVARPALGVLAFVLAVAATGAGHAAAQSTVSRLERQTGRIEVNAMEYPWSAIGRVNTGGRGHCTGFLIGERSVLTAAHCLYDTRERRWRGARELHFVAGYQRDTYTINSPVSDYRRAAGYDPGAAGSPASALLDWAILTLEKPIGRQAGWLSLRETDAEILTEARQGRALFLQAGYRQGWTQIMSVSLDCKVEGFFGKKRGIAHGCDLAKGDSGSPLMLLADGELSVTGVNVVDFETKSGRLAGALSVAIFRPGSGQEEAAGALRRSGATWGPGQAPEPGSQAAAAPVRTVETLLDDLGLLGPRQSEGSDARRRTAIETFQARAGLPVTGKASLDLLAHLITARK